MVSGTHTVHLTGNYLMPIDDGRASLYDEEGDEYDLSPDEEELDELDDMDEESDELDDIPNPRIMEIGEEDEVPKLVKQDKGAKGKNKRPAEDSEDEEEKDTLDNIMTKSIKSEGSTSAVGHEEKSLSKSQLKKLKKKQKMNDGEAKAITPDAAAAAAKTTNGEKKVQFAKNLEQGPTPSPLVASSKKDDQKKESKQDTGNLGVKTVQGVTIDDKKLGNGPTAKTGDRVGMRYIGKLENGKVFDCKSSYPCF